MKNPSGTYALRSTRVVTLDGVKPATVVVQDGRIVEVSGAAISSIVEDVGDLVISPGVIDAHVHVNEPGRTEWEGFETATKAAAAGGVTTIVDMPLNSSPVTTSAEALAAKQCAANSKCWVDVAFYGGLVPGNADHLTLLAYTGVLGVKAFLCHSGLDEFPNATERDLRAAMPILAPARMPLLVHAELLTSPAPTVTDPRSFAQFVASRPEQWELAAIELMIRLCRETRCPVHIVHLATSAALPMLAAAKHEGLPITVESCPHYLFFDQATIADGDTRFKCAPPIRRGEATKLWQGLLDGTIDTIGSDHSPCPPELKCLDSGDFTRAWGGISSLQLTLSTMWTFMTRQGNTDLARLSNWLSAAPAKLVGLGGYKGKIAPGYRADLVVWDPDAAWRVNSAQLFHRHPVTPFDGFEVRGKIARTYVRGRLVYQDGMHLDGPAGELLSRARSPGTWLAEKLNSLSDEQARQALENCCAASQWIEEMLARRPFVEDEAVFVSARKVASSLSRDQWLSAFAAHPKIGDLASLQKTFQSTTVWASHEQSGVAQANDETLHDLARYNRLYEEKFGYIFIVCATGKSASEMLSLLKSRIENDPATELPIAAAEQLKITLLRLEKLAAT